ncbi:MAG: ribonuclease P protein component [Roseinatronobacter sp.]
MARETGPAPHQMTPPGTEPVPAVLSCATLKRRADFLRVAKGRRLPCPAFLVQAVPAVEGAGVQVGYTCSKKVGNAVARNRAKRRLREVARRVMPTLARPGWDYVLVGRPGVTVDHNFAAMCADLERALRKLHGGQA